MSQFPAGAKTVSQKPTNNIFSALVFVAFVALTIGVSVVWFYNVELTGKVVDAGGQEYESLREPGESFPNPFYIAEKPAE